MEKTMTTDEPLNLLSTVPEEFIHREYCPEDGATIPSEPDDKPKDEILDIPGMMGLGSEPCWPDPIMIDCDSNESEKFYKAANDFLDAVKKKAGLLRDVAEYEAAFQKALTTYQTLCTEISGQLSAYKEESEEAEIRGFFRLCESFQKMNSDFNKISGEVRIKLDIMNSIVPALSLDVAQFPHLDWHYAESLVDTALRALPETGNGVKTTLNPNTDPCRRAADPDSVLAHAKMNHPGYVYGSEVIVDAKLKEDERPCRAADRFFA